MSKKKWNNDLIITSGRANLPLARGIASHCELPLTELKWTNFADGDWKPQFPDTIRGRTLAIVQSTNPTLEKGMGENWYELFMIVDAARRASAKEIIAIIPYYGGSRQDRKDEPRVPITASANAILLQAIGVHKVITLDLHVDQIQGFFKIPVDNLYASRFFVPIVRGWKLPNLSMSSADIGGGRRAEAYAKYLDIPLILFYKSKTKGKIEQMIALGDIKDRNIVLIDDIVDSAKTITKAGNILMEKGATSVRALGTHPVLSTEAEKRIDESGIEKFYFLDTIASKPTSKKIEIIHSAALFGDAIKQYMIPGGSVSKLFLF
ncbi:MAG: ribose-phosphate diphosphokinase [bacterium]